MTELPDDARHRRPAPRPALGGIGLDTTGAQPALRRHITPLDPAGTLPDWWEPLYEAACNRSIFLCGAWLQSWLEIYGSEFEGQWISWEKDGAIVAGCLCVTRRVHKNIFTFRTLYLNATGEATARTPLAEFNDILHLRDVACDLEREIIEDFAQLLLFSSWSRLMASGYQDDSLIARLMSSIPHAAIDYNVKPAPYVSLANCPESQFETHLSANTRYQVRRARRLYESRFGPLTITAVSDSHDVLRCLDEMAVLQKARWKKRGEPCSLGQPCVLEFHRRLIGRLASKGAMEMLVIRSGHHIIGYLYNYIDRGKVYYFQCGFDYEDDSKLKPGLLAHVLAIEHYKAHGLKEYDFLAGDAQYKRSFCEERRNINWTVLYRQRRTVRLFLWLRQLKQRVQ